MRNSLSSAREKKTDFTPRTGGNRYKVIRPDVMPVVNVRKTDEGGSEFEREGERSKSSSKKSGFNGDFLLARAIQTTMQEMEKRSAT